MCLSERPASDFNVRRGLKHTSIIHVYSFKSKNGANSVINVDPSLKQQNERTGLEKQHAKKKKKKAH
jgi:hypothetical protein